jgi:hypothetical protein
LIAVGAKKIETRSWATSYRGLVAIHQAKGLGPVGGRAGLQALCADVPFKHAIYPEILRVRTDAQGYEWPSWDLDRLPLGCIVAVATLMDCVITANAAFDPAQGDPWFEARLNGQVWRVPPPEPELSFGNYAPGRFAWLLSEVRRLPEPIPHRGALSLWAVPAEVEAKIAEQIGALR